jgi:hypothetical protein
MQAIFMPRKQEKNFYFRPYIDENLSDVGATSVSPISSGGRNKVYQSDLQMN